MEKTAFSCRGRLNRFHRLSRKLAGSDHPFNLAIFDAYLSTWLYLTLTEMGDYQITPKRAWEKILQFAREKQLDVSQEKLISIAYDDPTITTQETLRFDACITAPPNLKPEGEVGSQKLRGGRYAIFLHKGPYCDLEKSFEQIFADWYPTSGEEVAHFPCFCRHLNMEKERIQTAPETLLTEIYIPLK